ncbi:hypothetical protein GQS_06605 [Thermococcus sp. 4557]|uniref:hypothetical protein n=1 Tax=Thermococcus sp. (strain CGMCC 1.5172 / 4557) TaxID=1042877 RepID=UPI000219E904|nr:hypothetical protein [Thermococcus sp. 4557]AEK73219.1 hypothetical protein GQS_06605 [Thermococcus sp. 4557]
MSSYTYRWFKIKVKTLTREIVALADGLGLNAVPEYRTPDGTRIDIAILDGERKLLAIELEASFKWFPQRLLYDVVKAHRAGFPELWVVTPFRTSPGWVESYAKELGLKMEIKSDKKITVMFYEWYLSLGMF